MNERQDVFVELEIVQRELAHKAWVEDCKARMNTRWPEVDFDSDHWPLCTRYKTKLLDISFIPALADFEGKDPAYVLALKCLMAEIALKGEVKDPFGQLPGWRLLSQVDAPLHRLRRSHLIDLENAVIERAKASPSTAGGLYGNLLALRVQIDLVGAAGVTDRLAWNIAPQTKSQLWALSKSASINFRAKKASILERQIEALSDAQTAMFRGDDRLSAYDRVALAVMGLNMCCPNRVNEPLCMAADDRFTLEDYMVRTSEPSVGSDAQSLERVHQMLLVKGSKGAGWSGKPILNFMIALADLCISVIKQHGERSRMLVNWYLKYPDILYLPPELEHLRGTDINKKALWKITNLASQEPTIKKESNVKPIWEELRRKGFIKKTTNPGTQKYAGAKYTKEAILAVGWSDLEPVLLARVKQAMEELRRVTRGNHYQGRLSNMLMLFDSAQTPYLPGSIKYNSLVSRLRQTANDRKPSSGKQYRSDWKKEPTLFEKLGLKMVVEGAVETAYINTHDPRRWLTTQALDSGLPDVLANKWANRLSINQLKAYDLRSAEHKADQAAMPDVKELEDMTQGLQRLGAIEKEYGLKTQIVALGEANIAITSMNDIMQATEDRPIARTANQIIVLYPQRYGVCLHQHHERPCRSYKCAPCNEGLVVKGHLPTNDRVKKDADLVFRSIVNQLEALLIARQRELADNPQTLDEHILTLVREGLSPEQMAKELIARFHEINDQIKDRSFANKLGEAFALTGFAEQLDMESNRSGALIKYHNPSYHGAPGHERALEARHGGRSGVRASIQAFEEQYPQFAQMEFGKQDQRDMLETDEVDDHEADDQ